MYWASAHVCPCVRFSQVLCICMALHNKNSMKKLERKVISLHATQQEIIISHSSVVRYSHLVLDMQLPRDYLPIDDNYAIAMYMIMSYMHDIEISTTVFRMHIYSKQKDEFFHRSYTSYSKKYITCILHPKANDIRRYTLTACNM